LSALPLPEWPLPACLVPPPAGGDVIFVRPECFHAGHFQAGNSFAVQNPQDGTWPSYMIVTYCWKNGDLLQSDLQSGLYRRTLSDVPETTAVPIAIPKARIIWDGKSSGAKAGDNQHPLRSLPEKRRQNPGLLLLRTFRGADGQQRFENSQGVANHAERVINDAGDSPMATSDQSVPSAA